MREQTGGDEAVLDPTGVKRKTLLKQRKASSSSYDYVVEEKADPRISTGIVTDESTNVDGDQEGRAEVLVNNESSGKFRKRSFFRPLFLSGTGGRGTKSRGNKIKASKTSRRRRGSSSSSGGGGPEDDEHHSSDSASDLSVGLDHAEEDERRWLQRLVRAPRGSTTSFSSTVNYSNQSGRGQQRQQEYNNNNKNNNIRSGSRNKDLGPLRRGDSENPVVMSEEGAFMSEERALLVLLRMSYFDT